MTDVLGRVFEPGGVLETLLNKSMKEALLSALTEVQTAPSAPSSKKNADRRAWIFQMSYIRNWLFPTTPFPDPDELRDALTEFKDLIENNEEETMRSRLAVKEDEKWKDNWDFLRRDSSLPTIQAWRTSFSQFRSDILRNIRVHAAVFFKLKGTFSPRAFTADSGSQFNLQFVTWMQSESFFTSNEGFVKLQSAVLAGLPLHFAHCVKKRYITSETFMKSMIVNIKWLIKHPKKRAKSLSENSDLRKLEEEIQTFPSGFSLDRTADSAFAYVRSVSSQSPREIVESSVVCEPEVLRSDDVECDELSFSSNDLVGGDDEE